MDSYDKRRQELEAANLPLLRGFHQYLIEKRVGKRKSCDHVDRLEFFASSFLGDDEDQTLAEGYGKVDAFLGGWLIRELRCLNEDSLSANILTFQKFYDYLRSIGKIEQPEHSELLALIESSKHDWFRRLERYHDPSIALVDVWNAGDSDDPEHLQTADPAHLVIMLSGRSAKHFKIRSNELPKTDHLDAEGHWLDCWRCELVAEHRPSKTLYFLLTNARTLFSFVVPNDDRQIESLVSMLSQLVSREVARLRPEIKIPDGGTFSLMRGQPRRLIGCQNELIRCALHLFQNPNPSLDLLCRDLNHTPMMSIAEILPEEAFKKSLTTDPPHACSTDDSIIPFPPPPKN